MRVLNIWSSLAERYNRRLDEDDVVDILTGQVIKDRGVLSELPKRCNFGDLADKDGAIDTDLGSEAADNIVETDEDDNDGDEDGAEETHAFPSADGLVASKLARVGPPRPATNSSDVDDLHEFLKAEAIRRELDGGDEDDADDSSSEDELNFLPPRSTPAKRTMTPARKTPQTKRRPLKVPDPDTESEDEFAAPEQGGRASVPTSGQWKPRERPILDQNDLNHIRRAPRTPSPEIPASIPSPPPSSSPGPSSSFSLPPSPSPSCMPFSPKSGLQTEERFGSPTPQRRPVASASRKRLEQILDEIDLEFPPPRPHAPPAFTRSQSPAFIIDVSLSDDETEDEWFQPESPATSGNRLSVHR